MYAYYCLHKFEKWPHEFISLPRKEKAFVMAAIDLRIEAEKKAKKQ